MSTTKGADAGDAGADADVETIDIAGNLSDVQARITTACAAAGRDPASVRLVAVSKTKPVPLLEQCVAAGITVLGENYVQELVEKVAVLSSTHDTIVWHFIGALQSNKANMLVGAFKDSTVDRLVVETVSSLKLAKKLNNAVPDSDVTLLRIFVQVNTSGEDSKSGVEPGADCVELCRQIAADCPKLHLQGLMTIGAPGDESCFTTLAACRDAVADALEGRDRDSLELSMGMSGDFEQAIMAGATNIRVGSTIFGARDYSTSTTK
jgi:pyridoxal phosphate enzyme (YggS family)